MFRRLRIRFLVEKLRKSAKMLDELSSYGGRQVGIDHAYSDIFQEAEKIAEKLTHLLNKHHELLPKEEELIREYFPTVPVESWHEYKRDVIT